MSIKTSKERILASAMGLLSTKPMEEVTVREIAKQAQVNIASIHYYFSTKEILFSAAIDKIIFRDLDEWISGHINLQFPKKNDLVDFLEYLHVGCIHYREFAKTRVRNNLNLDEVNQANLKIYQTIFQLIKNLKMETENNLIKLKTSLVYGSLAAVSCSPADMSAFTGFDLTTETALRTYLKNVVKILFIK